MPIRQLLCGIVVIDQRCMVAVLQYLHAVDPGLQQTELHMWFGESLLHECLAHGMAVFVGRWRQCSMSLVTHCST